jgi:selenocysteine lyase/cysteine desulfurase
MLSSQRHLFDLPREVAYLNAAYMTPLPLASTAAGEAGLRRKARPWTIRPADFFTDSERARELFARLIGAGADDVALVPAASYGIAVAAANLALVAGQRILTLRDQFPSNFYAWRRLAAERGGEVVAVDGQDLTEAVLLALDEGCRIAALPQVRWTDGRRLDLVSIGARCREVGAALVLDLTQSLGVMALDVAAVQPDFLVCAAYKWLLGPYSVGWLYVAPRHQQGRPLEESWITRCGAEDFARLVDYQDDYAPGARRFDVGERSNFALLPAAIASLELLLDLDPEAVRGRLARLTRLLAEAAAEHGLAAVPEALRAPHFLGLDLPPAAPGDLLERLAADNVLVSQRGTRLRVTPHIYNDEEDVARFGSALARALGRGSTTAGRSRRS